MTYDIIIIGGGPAGLCFATSLAQSGLRLAVIEKLPRSALAAPQYDGREIALTHLSQKIMQNIGVWDRLPQEQISMIKTAKVMNGSSPYALTFYQHGSGHDFLGYMISNNEIRKASFEAMAEHKHIDLIDETSVLSLGSDDKASWVELDNGQKIEASLIASADSRFSETRRQMGIPCDMKDFGRTCIVFTMKADKPHDDTAYECFHMDRTLAILPLHNNQVSVVITLPSEEKDAVLTMTEGDLRSDIERRTEGRFGVTELSSKLFSYPLVATLARKFYTGRYALIGDAAVGMHPVTAHGFNLGLRSVHTLADNIQKAIGAGEDFASLKVLEEYSNAHRRAVLPIYHGTNMLVHLYTKQTPSAKVARHGLLRIGNILKPAKNMIINQLTETKAA